MAYGILIVLCKINLLAEIIWRTNFVSISINDLHGGDHMHEYLHYFATSCILQELCIGQNAMKGHFYLNIQWGFHEVVQRRKYPYCVATSHSINTFFTKTILSAGIFLFLHWSRNHLMQSVGRNIHIMLQHCIHLQLLQSNTLNYILQGNTYFMHCIFHTRFFYLKKAHKLCEYT
jgi:hypothetical protein